MSIDHTALMALYQEIDLVFAQHQREAGLSCLPECGKCCLSPDVAASVFEMGPLAQQLLQQGQAEEIWDQLQKLDFEESSQRPCIMYKKNNAEGDKGQCSVYLYRPLICRVFGAFARRNKYGAKELSLCKLIADKVNLSAEEKASKAQEAPAVALWRKRLEELNPNPGGALLPINKALKLALQDVLLKNHYRDNNSKTVLP